MKILHLEDSPHDAELIESVVTGEWPDAQIHLTGSRAEFQAALELGGFDLILSDYSMPGFDGLTALGLAQKWCPDKPYIFMSGTIGEERAIEALQRGATDYVIKDRPGRLVPAIRTALARVEDAVRRRGTEEALRQNQERFRQIAENVADMIAVLDLDGRRLYNNPAYRDVLGDPEALRGTLSFDEIHPEDRDFVRLIFAETVRTGAGKRIEYRFLRPDGTIRYIESQGSVIRNAEGRVANVLVVSRDVTERRAAELQLREQAALLDKARDAIIATDLDHRITYWNASAERLYGWSAAEVLGRPLGELGLGYQPARFAFAHAQLLASGEWRGNFNLHTRAGGALEVESTWSLVLGADGKRRSILLIDTDITEKRKLETQLLRADRIDSIGMLAGGVAHDLNNVLAPILMGSEMLRGCCHDPKDLRIVEAIESSAQHGAALVRQLLAFARGSEGERTEVRMSTLLEDMPKLLRQSLPRKIQLAVACAESAWSILADATEVKQVLLNLSLNARDAMPNGGRLEIRAGNTEVDEKLAQLHPGAQPGPHLLISVSDTGEGIPPLLLEKIFDPFFTTKGVGRGTGLGLSTVAGIVRSHGGFLQVESRVGQGTTFQLFIPALLQPPPGATRASPPLAEAGRGEKILLIDDDANVRDTFHMLLERAGYQVVTAEDGRKGLAEFEQHRGSIAAVITDMMMPIMNGPQLIAAVRAQDPKARIIAISGFFDADDIASGFDRKAVSAMLAKPVDASQLLDTLRRVIAA